MKKILFPLLLTFFIVPKAWGVDCNQPKAMESVNYFYICTDDGLKKINNDIRNLYDDMEKRVERLKRRDSRLNEKKNELSLKENKTDGDLLQIKEFEEKITQNKNLLNKEKDEIGYVNIWLKNNYNRVQNCQTKECLSLELKSMLAQLESYVAGQARCEIPQISPECEIYAFNQPKLKTKSSDIWLSDEEYTYKEKIRINRPQKCVYLFLSSYVPSVFDIVVSKDTNLKAIYVGNSKPTLVRGFPQNTQVFYESDSMLRKNHAQCFNDWYRDNSIFTKLESLSIPKERVKLVSTNLIGENTEISNFEFQKENTRGSEPVSPKIKPEEDGWKELVQQGKVRLLKQSDLEKLEQAGIVSIDNSKFIFTQRNYKKLFSPELLHFHNNSYVVLDNIENLPKAQTNHEATVFIPYDAQIANNVKTEPTFNMTEINPMFDHSFIIMAPLEEVKKW